MVKKNPKPSIVLVELKNQLDATKYAVFIASTCFGHKYTYHHQATPSEQCSLQAAQHYTTQVAFQVWPPKSGSCLLILLLMMGILVPETCWGNKTAYFVASGWFFTFTARVLLNAGVEVPNPTLKFLYDAPTVCLLLSRIFVVHLWFNFHFLGWEWVSGLRVRNWTGL
jgi:hypothetical protein